MSLEIVETVQGPVPGETLGITQMHEHLLKDTYSPHSGFGQVMDDVEVAVDEMGRFRMLGGGTIVELSLRGGGRDPAGLRRISEESGVHIVMGIGVFRREPAD